jgi:dipeptidyl aminopeptidase/acylaminoacyl peptidase
VGEASSVASGQTTDLTAEEIVDGAKAHDPVISPDGHWVAWTVSRAGKGDEDRELWLAPVGGNPVPFRLAEGSAKARLPRWSPDSASLFYVAGEELRRIRVPAEGATAPETVLQWGGEISDLVPLADGRRVALVAGDERTDEDKRREADGDDVMVWSERAARQHWTWHRLRLLDLATGELTVAAVAAEVAGRHVLEATQRPDGGPLAVLSWDCPEWEPGAFTARLQIVGLDGGENGGVSDGTAAADLGPAGLEARSPAWWRGTDGWHVAWLSTPPNGVGAAVCDAAVPPDTISPDTAPTAAGTRTVTGIRAPDKPADLTAGMTLCPAELIQTTAGPPVALFAEGLDTALYQLDPAAAPGPAFRRVTGWTGLTTALSASADGAAIAVLASTAYTPIDVHAGPPDGLGRVSDTRPELRGIAWGTQERLTWRAADGLELDGILNLPPGRTRADGPFPLITLVRGGPYSRWADEFMLSWVSWGQWLATAGFAVFHPNARGGEGHGQDFAGMVAKAVGGDEWTDILSGIDALVADGVADADRLGIAGPSHGGFISAWAVTQTDRFRAAVVAAGIVDWGLQVSSGEMGRAEADLCGSLGWEGPGPHRHDQVSPVSYASKVTTPVLILHGEQDTNVPVGQAMYFHRALMQFGVEHDLVIYPRENHSFTERAHQADVLQRARAWFTRWLGEPARGGG